MLWRRSAQTPAPSLAPLVPEGESVRLSALQASWRRDRWVARRRLALRWLAWIGWRYGLPALGLLAAVTLAWRIVLGWPTGTVHELPASPPVPTLAPEPTSHAQEEPMMRLRLDPAWPSAQDAPGRQAPIPFPAASDSDATTRFTPHLKPENWLHSKEP